MFEFFEVGGCNGVQDSLLLEGRAILADQAILSDYLCLHFYLEGRKTLCDSQLIVFSFIFREVAIELFLDAVLGAGGHAVEAGDVVGEPDGLSGVVIDEAALEGLVSEVE